MDGLEVALRKESVDRKCIRANGVSFISVALRKESVDRKIHPMVGGEIVQGRSPQGERG